MAVTAPSASAKRPILMSADKRKISYTSKSGKTLTVELRQSSRAVTTLRELASRETKEDLERKKAEHPDASLWPGLFDTVSFWCMEAVEIACFGPYDETKPVQPTETADPTVALAA